MVRRSKAKEKEPGLLNVLQDLCKEKGIAPEVVFEAIETGLLTAYRKNFGSEEGVRVVLDRETGECHIYARKTVVAEKTGEPSTIAIEEARKIHAGYEVDDVVELEVTPANFGRVAAQTAKQVVTQRIRSAEQDIVYYRFSERKNDIVSGFVSRVENRNIFLNLDGVEATIPESEQIQKEQFTQGKRIKVYITDVKKGTKGTEILVSRTHPGFLKRLFEMEVPEIQEGIVEIRSVAREAGARSKIAVHSNDEDVDPIGACVGQRGIRVQAVVDELGEEKIDIVKWSAEPEKFIANALSPAKVVSVTADEAEKSAQIIVPDYQLSLAIGKGGQNSRLAAKLTGWKIDIISESNAADGYVGDDMDTDFVAEEIAEEE